MLHKKTSKLLLVILIFSSFGIQLTAANQEFMGAYMPHDDCWTCNKVIFDCDFQNTDPSDISISGNLIAGSWVNGADGTTPGKYDHQNVFFLYNNGDVRWIPQIWSPGSKLATVANVEVGDNEYYWFYGKTEIKSSTDKVYFKAFAYEDQWEIEHDAPTIYSYWPILPNEDEDNFVIGSQIYEVDGYNIHFKSFMTGCEAKYQWSPDEMRIRIGHMGYYDGSTWKYEPVKSVPGNLAFITLDPVTEEIGSVGGNKYNDVDVLSSSDDLVIWEKDDSTISDYTEIWDGDGTVDQVVSYPFTY